MKRITLIIEDDLHKKLRLAAAEEDLSVSKLIIKRISSPSVRVQPVYDKAIDGATGTPVIKEPEVQKTQPLDVQLLIKKQASGRALTDVEKAKLKVAGFTPASALVHPIKRKLFCRHGLELGKCPHDCTESTTNIK